LVNNPARGPARRRQDQVLAGPASQDASVALAPR